MSENSILRFDVGRTSDAHAIADALRLDREDVISVSLDSAGKTLCVETLDADAAQRVLSFINSMIRSQRFVSRRIVHENRTVSPRFFDRY